MAIDNISRKILEISQRVENIRMQSLRDPGHAAEILADAIKELQISIEELSVAEEELYQQSEELVGFHNALEAERQRYMELFDQAPDGYLVTDPEGNIQEANCAASAMLNVRQDLLVGRPMIDFVTDTVHPAFCTYLAGLRQGAEVSDWELLLQPLESASIPVSLSVSFVRDSKGQLTGLRWLLHDITARKKIEKAYQAAKDILEINNLHTELKPFLSDCVAYLKNFSGCAAVGIRILDKEGNIPYQAYGGFSQSFFEMDSPLSIKSDLCMCINVVKGETDFALPFYTQGGSFYMNGTTRFLATVSEEAKGQTRNVCNKVGYESVALIPIRIRDKILGLIYLADPRENMVPLYLVEVIEQAGAQMGVALDRIQAEAALRKSDAELKLVTDGVPLLLAHVGSDLRYIFVNQAYADWFQIPKDEIIGRHISEVLSQEGYEATTPCIRKALFGERTAYELVVRKDGQLRSLDIAFVPQLDRHGEVRSYYAITQDITERKQAMKEIENLAKFPEENPNPILRIATDGTIIYANRSSAPLLELWGCSSGQMLPDDYRDLIQEALISGNSNEIEAISGSKIYSLVFTPIEDKGYVNIYGRDVTEQTRARDALLKSEESMRLAAEAAEVGTFTYNFKSGVGYWSPELKALLGVKTDEPIRMDTDGLVVGMHPEDRAASLAALRQACDPHRDGKFQIEYRLVLPDDSIRWLRVSGRIDFTGVGEDRHPWQSAGATVNITELKRAEEAQRESEERLRFVLETCHIGAWDMDIADHTTIRSPEHDRIYGYDVMLPQWTYEMFLEHVVPEDRAWVDATYQHAVKTQNSWSFEFRIRRPDGQVRWIWATGDHRRDADGSVRRVAGIVQDITERKRMEEELKKAKDELELRVEERTAELQSAKEELESMNEELQVEIEEHKQTEKELMAAKDAAEAATRAKADFLANMSHEIRTPMNAVIGMTSLLLGDQLTSEQRDFVETIRTSGDALMVIINDILDVSKMESGKVILEEQPFDIRQCAEEALDLVAVKAAEKGLNLAYIADKNVPVKIIGDPNRLRQILGNLLNNAVKFTDDGEVKLYVFGNQDGTQELHFAVQDTGIGIPQDKMDLLFQSFSQLETSTARLYGGTGLGLAISKRLVEMMGGRIWVESKPGEGSTFHFTIRAESVPGESKTYPTGVQPPLLGKCVLIVDDNKTNRRILGLQVYSWGMTPITATSGQEALRWIRRGDDFDIAILDMNMPEMDGLTLAGEIRKYNKTLPLVILTSIGQRVSSDHAYLVRPIKPSQLYNILVEVFAKQPIKELLEASAVKKTHDEPLRILLAEDNVSSQKVVTGMLSRLGYKPDTVANGIEALQALERQPYDVVLMDVGLPEMDGLEATRIIRQRWPDNGPKVIAVTAYAIEGDREKCLAAGMDDYLPKPVKMDDLKAVLGRNFMMPGANR